MCPKTCYILDDFSCINFLHVDTHDYVSDFPNIYIRSYCQPLISRLEYILHQLLRYNENIIANDGCHASSPVVIICDISHHLATCLVPRGGLKDNVNSYKSCYRWMGNTSENITCRKSHLRQVDLSHLCSNNVCDAYICFTNIFKDYFTKLVH